MTKFNKKEWTDRQVQYPNRRTITNDDTGEVTHATITRNEGELIQAGDLLDAYNLNDLEDRIATAVDSKTTVAVKPIQVYGTRIAEITIDGTTTKLFAPTGGGGGGSTVEVEQLLSSGTETARIRVDGQSTSLYAPNATNVSVNPILTSGTKIAEITVNGIKTDLYAPQGGGGSSELVEAIRATCSELSHTDYDEEHEKNYRRYLSITDNGDGTYTGTFYEDSQAPSHSDIIIFLTTESANISWKIYWMDYSSQEHVVLEDSGIVQDKLIYIPKGEYFAITFTDDTLVTIYTPGAAEEN